MWSRLRTAHSFWLRIVHDSWRFVPVLKSNDCRRSLRTCVRRFLKQCARFSKACARAHVYVHVSWRFVLCLAQIFTSIGVSVHDSAKLVPVLTYMCTFHEGLCFVWRRFLRRLGSVCTIQQSLCPCSRICACFMKICALFGRFGSVCTFQKNFWVNFYVDF